MRRLILNGETVEAVVRSKTIDAPPMKTNVVEVEGANGVLDLSTVLTDGNPTYGARKLQFSVAIIGVDFFETQSEFNNKYHGVEVEITTEDAPDIYYRGRCQLSAWKEEKGFVSFTINIEADPFKYEREETVITAEASMPIGTLVSVPNGRKWLSPTLTASEPLSVKAGAVQYLLQAGSVVIPDIILKSGDNELLVIGSGTLEIKYRKGWL